MKIRFLALIIFLLTFINLGFAQSERVKKMETAFNAYLLKGAEDSAFILSSNFIKQKDLSAEEKFYAHLIQARLFIKTSALDEAVSQIRLCMAQVPKIYTGSNKYETIANEAMASAFYSWKKYDSAFVYALKAEARIHHLNRYQASENAQIIGSYLIEKQANLTEGLVYFEKALAILPTDQEHIVHRLDALSKILMVHAKRKSAEKVRGYSEEMTRLLARDPNNTSSYLVYQHLVAANKLMNNTTLIKRYTRMRDSVAGIMNENKTIKDVETLLRQAKVQLKEQENQSLKQHNNDIENTVAKQRLIILMTAVAVVLFIVLSFFIFKTSQQRKKTNQLLEKQKLQAEENNKELIRLNTLNQKIFSVISHDFKGPISVLTLMLNQPEIVQSDNTVFNTYINDINNQLRQSNRMLDDLLDWGRSELSDHSNKKHSTVNEVVAVVVNQLAKNLQAKDIRVSNQFPEKLIFPVAPEILAIALRNLISNAVKFSYPHSSITLIGRPDYLAVIDEGTGIKEEKIAKLFKQKLMPEFGTGLEGGFGIGLYLCYELLRKHGCIITASNNSNKGATFTITPNLNAENRDRLAKENNSNL